jgi:hypothetical protein
MYAKCRRNVLQIKQVERQQEFVLVMFSDNFRSNDTSDQNDVYNLLCDWTSPTSNKNSMFLSRLHKKIIGVK